MSETAAACAPEFFDADANVFAQSRWFGTQVARSDYAMTRELLLRYLELAPEQEVLEIGCGPGVWTSLISTQVRSVTALDVSERMLSEARNRVSSESVSFVHCDVMDYRNDRAFDRVLSVRVIEYIPDKTGLAERLYRLLKPGGRAVIVTKPRSSILMWRGRLLDRLGRHRPADATALQSLLHLLDPDELAEALKAVGLCVACVAPVLVRFPCFGRGGYRWLAPSRLGEVTERALLRAGNFLARKCNSRHRLLTRVGLACAESYVVVADRPR